MAGLKRWLFWGAPVLLLASCASLPPVATPIPQERPPDSLVEVTVPQSLPEPPLLRMTDSVLPAEQEVAVNLARPGPEARHRPSEDSLFAGERVSPLDLESWPFGWVQEPRTSSRLGLPLRFWSDQKAAWKELLAARTPLVVRVRRLGQVAAAASSTEEELRADWLLAEANTEAGLLDEARRWLDKAYSLTLSSSVALERSWDQLFRLGDPEGARALWPGIGHEWPDETLKRKAALLRSKLFSGTRSAASVGADDYFATQVLDHDDLWAATWNGSVVRWSLVTDTVELLYPPGKVVSPIKLLAVTGWFVYAFQDQALLRYSKVTGSWRTFAYPEGWTGLRVQAVVAEGQESLWVAYLGQGLWRWDSGQWSLVDDAGGGPFLNALAADGSGGYWIGTKDRGLWAWSNGVWSSVTSRNGPGPSNVTLIEADPDSRRWLVGSWGEGTWILEDGWLTRWSPEPDYVTAAAWSRGQPLWGALDQGLVWGTGPSREVLGPRDGLPPGGVSGLTVWDGRWIWGTNGQGWGWWSEYENPTLLR